MGEKSKSAKKKTESPKSTKKVQQTLPIRSKETIEDSDAMISSSEDDAEESSDEEDEQPKAKDTVASTPARSNAPAQGQTPGRSTNYNPPADFARLSASEYSSKNPFSAKNLAGKEIWYITAPANVPLSALTTLNPIDVAEGNPIMEADGRSYCLRAEDDTTKNESGLGLLVADSTGQYRTAKQSIQKTFRIVEAPPSTFLAPKDMVPKTKPVKEQPKGLKQRFMPIGAVATGEQEVEDVDMMDIDEPEPEVKSEERKKKKHKSSHAEKEDGEKKKKKKKSKTDEP